MITVKVTLGVDIAVLVVDIIVLGVDIHSSVGRTYSSVMMMHGDKGKLNTRLFSMYDASKRVGVAGCLGAPGAPEGVERYILDRFLEVDEDGAWIVEGPYEVASQDVV